MRVNSKYFFCIFEPESWEDALNYSKYLDSYWVFRGQSDALWRLSTTLGRSAQRQEFHHQDLLSYGETLIIDDFRRRASHFIHNIPEHNNYLEWLALIQHHGGPTRLLDFSKSFYIASFFAIEAANTDCAIWAINTKFLNTVIDQFKPKHKLDKYDIFNTPRELVNQIVGSTYMDQFVIPVEPYHMNERLAAQKGLFLFKTDISKTFYQNLATSFEQEPEIFDKNNTIKSGEEFIRFNSKGVVLKMMIPRKSRKEAIDDLRSMNITATTLFPGLDGFARSLHYHLSVLQQK